MTDKTVPAPLEQALATIIEKTTSAVSAGVDFLSEQIPDVIQQLLMWKLVQSSVMAVLFLLLAAGMIYWGCKVKEWMIQERDWHPGHYVIWAVAFATTCGSVSNIFEALKIWIAPKVWLIEYSVQLLK